MDKDLDNKYDSSIQKHDTRENEQQEYSFPFSIDLGLSSVKGILHLLHTALKIEWREFDAWEVPKSKLRSLDIPLADVKDMLLKRTLFGSRLTITFSSASILGDFPLPAGTLNILKCSVKRKHSREAGLLAAETTLRIAESE